MTDAAVRRRVAFVVTRRAFAELLAAAVNATGDLVCTGVGADVYEVTRARRDARDAPDVVVVDLSGDRNDLPAVIDELQRRWPRAWPLVLTGHHLSPERRQPFTAVARGCSVADLLDAVRTAGRGVMVLPADHGPHLTPRERDVLHLLADGHGAPAIAERLGMSVHTCRGHLKNLRAKFGVHNQVELAMRARPPGALGARARAPRRR
jgi:DNA-binding NarL/FixJ family response regulator